MPTSINDAIKACQLRQRNPTNSFCLLNALTAACAPGGVQLVTHSDDRESDLYEEWATVPDDPPMSSSLGAGELKVGS